MSVLTPTAEGNPNRSASRAVYSGALRQAIDALVCLAIAVILFRSFEVEGYMISTGSMAPSLLGFHKRVICPNCGYQFAFGVSFDDFPESDSAREQRSNEPIDPVLAQAGSVSQQAQAAMHAQQLSCCPNCGQSGIDVAEIPRNQGDQLLVNKSAYAFQNPRRWEVIVFRNPYNATQAYVKRTIGLPGERIQVVDGDIYADGKICRKDLDSQRAVRIPVFDSSFVPGEDPDWRPRWVSDPCVVPWKPEGPGFVIDRSTEEVAERPDDDPSELAATASSGESARDDQADAAFASTDAELRWSWVTYHHWVRSGGTHRTSVRLEPGVPEFRIPEPVLSPVQFDGRTRHITCVGAMSRKTRDGLLAANTSSSATSAINELYRESHLSPVVDVYGYNQPDGGFADVPVRDLMFEADVSVSGGAGAFVVEMTDGHQTFDCVFDLLHREARLHIDGQKRAARTVSLGAEGLKQPAKMEMSLFDRQVIVTLHGSQLFEPLLLEEKQQPAAEPPRHPVRFGARGIRAEVQSIELYRDVHYTRGRARNGVDEPYELGPDEYFVLGDNSPVSSDSRNWPDGAVAAHLLLGKPFVVHLPSRPAKLQLGGTTRYIRIPDFARMRYIR